MIKKNYSVLLGLLAFVLACFLPSQAIAQNEIKVTVGDKGWFRIERLVGSNITVEGMPASFTAQTGKKISQDYNAMPNSTVTFKGDITGLRIAGEMHGANGNGNVKKRADVVSIDASKAPSTLTFLVLKGLSLNSIDLKGATELKILSLIDLSKQKLNKLDLSKQTKVNVLILGNSNFNNNSIEEVVMPSPNVIQNLDLGRTSINKIDLDHLPELLKFRAVAANASSTGLNVVELKESTKLKLFVANHAHIREHIILKDKPMLNDVMLFGNLSKQITIENCPLLKDYTNSIGLWLGIYNGNYLAFSKVSIKNTGITKIGNESTNGFKNVVDLDISNNPLTSVNFAPYTKLNKVTMNAKEFNNLDVNQVLATLPQRKPADNAVFVLSVGDDTEDTLVAKVEAKLQEKGWSLQKPVGLSELADGATKIYPTQTTDVVNIEGAKANATYKLFTMNGSLCEKGQTDAFGSAELHLASYSKGVYIIKLGNKFQKIVLK